MASHVCLWRAIGLTVMSAGTLSIASHVDLLLEIDVQHRDTVYSVTQLRDTVYSITQYRDTVYNIAKYRDNDYSTARRSVS